MKKYTWFLIIPLLLAVSCNRDKSILETNFIEATVNGTYYRAENPTTSSFYYNGQFISTKIHGNSNNKHISFEFYCNDLIAGSHPLSSIHASDSSGIIGSWCNLAEMTNPECEPNYFSKSGNINISTIDTGTYEGYHGVIMHLEATFNFVTDSIHGSPKSITNGQIVFNREPGPDAF